MDLPQSNTQILVFSCTRPELQTSLLSLLTGDCLKDINIGYYHPCRYRLRCKKKKKVHPFVAASFNEQSVMGNDMACKCHKTSTFRKDNDVDLFLTLKHGLVHKVTTQKLLKHSHINRYLVAVELLQYINLT